MEKFYDVDYEINKRKSYMKHMSLEQLDYEMENGTLSVPEPVSCPGLSHLSECPRVKVIQQVYKTDPCEYCSHSLSEEYVNKYQY